MGKDESSLHAPTPSNLPIIPAGARELDLEREITPVNELNQDGFTQLHKASVMGNLDVVRQLLSISSDICLPKDEDGWTPLHYAAIKGRVNIIGELLSRCPQALEERTAGGQTALHLAVMNDQFNAAKLLVEKATDGDANELIKAQDGDWTKVSRLAMASKLMQISNSRNREVGNGTSREVLSGHQLEGGTSAARKASPIDKLLAKWDSALRKRFNEESILVEAALIATVTYQAGLSPPQTIWNNHLEPYENCYRRFPGFKIGLCRSEAFYEFMFFNTTGFFASILLIFFRRPIYVCLLLVVAVLAMVATYITLTIAMAPSITSFFVINGLGLLLVFYFLGIAKLGQKFLQLVRRRARS